MTRTPVALFVFNRPDFANRVLAAVRAAQPPRLLVVADGPRPNRPDDEPRCAQTRALFERLDWDCEVLYNYADTNLGCRQRITSGLEWVFSQVEEAILLEDDCIPDPTFFRFCDELLERYRHDGRVMTISGNNPHRGWRRGPGSYYFSRFFNCWGWASWRRSWQLYDPQMRQWPQVCEGGWLQDVLGDGRAEQYYRPILQKTFEGQIDSWAYRWLLSGWLHNVVHIHPSVNLVTNIGFDGRATHTSGRDSVYADQGSGSLDFPLVHPPFMVADSQADQRTVKLALQESSRLTRMVARLRLQRGHQRQPR
jgi:hypothetical protein